MICPEAELRASMTDEEFWGHVLGMRDDEIEFEPDEDDVPELLFRCCARCGGRITAEDHEGLIELIEEAVAFCDDCAEADEDESIFGMHEFNPAPWERLFILEDA